MKKRSIIILSIFFLTACTQNFLLYIKERPKKSVFSVKRALEESGLIFPQNQAISNTSLTNKNYSDAVLIPNENEELIQSFNTLEVDKNSIQTIKVNTENYLFALPYYTSPHIIYNESESNPKQGIFQFMIGDQAGIIKIRIYTPEGLLKKEITWYIEIKTS